VYDAESATVRPFYERPEDVETLDRERGNLVKVGRMPTLGEFANRNPHDPILMGDDLSSMAAGHHPTPALEKIQPPATSIPSREVMAKESRGAALLIT
jgi:hypothetical protein